MSSILQTRFELLQKSFWTEDNRLKFDAILIVSHPRERKHIYTLDDSLYVWLFQNLEPLVYVVLEPEAINVFITSKQYDSITDFLRLPFLKVSKFQDEVQEHAVSFIKEKGFSHLGVSGDWINEAFLADMPTVQSDFELEEILIVHENSELTRTRNAVKIADHATQKILEKNLFSIIQDHEPTECRELSRVVEAELNKPDAIGLKFKQSDVFPAFPPAISCGTNVDLSYPPECVGSITDDIICSTIGVRFKSYVGVTGRTYIVNPTKRQKAAYKSLVRGFNAAISAIKVGATCEDIYQSFVNSIDEEFKPYVPESIGSFIGIQISTDHHPIKNDTNTFIKEGTSLLIITSLANVPDDEPNPPFSLQITDTVQVLPEEVKRLSKLPYKYKYVAYNLDTSAEKKVIEDLLNDNSSMIERTRGHSKKEKKVDKEQKRTAQILEQFKEAKDWERTEKVGQQEQSFDNQISYENPMHIPSNRLRGKTNRIAIDPEAKTVLLPIYGIMVPFHISTVKQSKEEEVESKFSNLSIQFDVPKNIPPENSKYVYIKSLMFSTQGIGKFTAIAKQITKLKQQYAAEMKKRRDDKDLFQNTEKFEKLEGNIPRIGGGNLHIKPALTGKKNSGNLEAHKNAFRYRSTSGDQQIIFYKNIRLGILQMSKNETFTVLHFLLKKPIKIANKGTVHVTFYKQVVESSVDTSARGMSGMNDHAEFAEEERERKIRKKINGEFRAFVRAVRDLDGFTSKIEKPERSLGFYGVLDKSKVYLMPTITALVSIQPTDAPFVFMRYDIELAVFERLRPSARTFDLTFILTGWETKDANQTSFITISTIDVEYQERINGWLDVILDNRKPYVLRSNIDWKKVMPTIRKKLESFNKEGGWDAFLQDEDESDDEDESSEFDPGDSEFDESDDDDDDEEFDAVPDEDEDEGGYEDSSDEGQDWRQLEEEAKAADARHAHRFDDSDDERRHSSHSKRSSKRK
ncbi:FACT complex subunit SPT16 [Histomonas meleagridis]|uniref:FACT complex subunit SPT16 n=1 Tax=Histomonas meleagridis TaxID=135588 RepID=UPI00355A3E46|nr:FACT complex subunit SPT16 [Histomonas meleagridis]KAH0796926.1 FACT complex subunit SPT16 [Histomonas meleagridis]